MVLSRDAAILEAEKALEEIKAEYPRRLRDTIDAMQAAADAADFGTLATVAYDLKGEAGTVGWPLVSHAAGWLRQALETEDADPDPQVVAVFLQSIRRLAEPDLAGETADGIKLIKELHALCVSKDVDPA